MSDRENHSKWEDTVFYNVMDTMRVMYKGERKKKLTHACIWILVGSHVISSVLTQLLFFHYISIVGIIYFTLVKGMSYFVTAIFLTLFFSVLGIMLYVKTSVIFMRDYKKDKDKNYLQANSETYGSAKWMQPDVVEKTFEKGTKETIWGNIYGEYKEERGILLAQKENLRKVNRNTVIFGGPNSGKSACIIINMLFQIMRRGESAIVSDPKGELFKIVSEVAKSLGYEVRIINFNPLMLDNSDACNLMACVGDSIDKAQSFANTIIQNTTAVKQQGEFWTEGALNYLAYVILRINCSDDYPEEKKNLPEVYNYLITHSLEAAEMDGKQLPPNHPAKKPFEGFTIGKPDVKSQTIQGLIYKLKILNSPKLRKILCSTAGSVNILNPGQKKCMYFVGSNDQDSSVGFIISLFYTLLYQELVAFADRRQPQELPVTVHMVLDEYKSMGNIPDFENKLSTVRSRNIVTTIVLQDINQLEMKHPMGAHYTILNDCDYYINLKSSDKNTIDFFIYLCGNTTTTVRNKRITSESVSDFLKLHPTTDITEGEGTRELSTAHEIRTMPDDELLLVVSGRDAIKIKTFFYMNHPYAAKINEVLPAEHYPLWKLIEDGIVTKDFDYDHEPTIRMPRKKEEKVELDKEYNPEKLLGIEEPEELRRKRQEVLTEKVYKYEGVKLDGYEEEKAEKTEKKPLYKKLSGLKKEIQEKDERDEWEDNENIDEPEIKIPIRSSLRNVVGSEASKKPQNTILRQPTVKEEEPVKQYSVPENKNQVSGLKELLSQTEKEPPAENSQSIDIQKENPERKKDEKKPKKKGYTFIKQC